MAAQHAGQAMQTVVEVRNVGKRYGIEGRKRDGSVTQALDHVSFAVAAGEFTGIMGPSGSGKSTLLNCLATIDAPTSGSIHIGGRDVGSLAGKELARFRREELGFIFQDSNLLDTLTAYENIALALTIQKIPAREIDARVQEAARTLGISDVLQKHPYQLSGGQKQRVAAARATVGRPRLVLADEPTGALDSKSARQLLESLAYLNSRGSTILMVTHDSFSASYCNRIIFIKDGGLFGELRRSGAGRGAFYRKIVEMVSTMGGAGDDEPVEGEVARHAC
ncbi:ABC transporter ATP-binding protein [Gordonibacter pamelaeae]|nr:MULTISPECIES: ABC transporter ATP-binding protein [Gordonibacter]ROT91803.1 multidrug ABC transporter ATP-binding protein [Gordonibacter urolithinfaciens]GKG90164.1 ABC transporter ATP-binding protein [Gordonibacter pamelaeae]